MKEYSVKVRLPYAAETRRFRVWALDIQAAARQVRKLYPRNRGFRVTHPPEDDEPRNFKVICRDCKQVVYEAQRPLSDAEGLGPCPFCGGRLHVLKSGRAKAEVKA
ncbi:hypothetical protein DRO42_02890 [Candidatus Bathyarchaeota archaeon]|nr:MAG: hypothetical protein DRO42_02890 [Candidatus Bathyarchaeota archaeon]